MIMKSIIFNIFIMVMLWLKHEFVQTHHDVCSKFIKYIVY